MRHTRRIHGRVSNWRVRITALAVAVALLRPGADAQQRSLTQQKPTDAAAVDLQRGLVAYLPFEGNPEDTSGNRNHGSPHGIVEYGEGKVGQAVQFLGDDDRGFVTITNSDSLKFDHSTTFACWFHINDDAGQTGENNSAAKVANAHQVLVAKHGDRAGFSLLTLGEIGSRRLLTLIGQSFSPNEVGVAFPPHEPVGRWHHVASVAGKDGVRLYFNGTLVHSTQAEMDLLTANECDIFIGINGPAGLPSDPDGFLWFPLNGAIDELRIYNRELSQQEVQVLAGLDAAEAVIDTSAMAESLKPFSAEQATGLPDTPNRHEHARTAWASESPDDRAEWLLLEFARAVEAKAVLVYETSNGGAINKLSVFDTDETETEVWSGHTLRTRPVGTTVPAVLPFSEPMETRRVKIHIDSAAFPGWNQIDAVGLRDVSGSVQWAVKATASSTRSADE